MTPRTRWLQVLWAVLAGAAGFVTACGGEDAEPAAPTAAEESATTGPSVEALEWSLVAVEDQDFSMGGEISRVVTGGPGFVAVGSAEGDSAVWSSPDGVNWNRVTDVPDTVPSGMGGLAAVTVDGPGLVALSAPGPFGLGEVAVWISPDGQSWTHIGGGDAVFGDDGLADLTAGGPGLVAVGVGSGSEARTSTGVVWTSPDGLSWTRVTHDDATFDNARINAVVTGGPGFVAVGSAPIGQHDDVAVVWTSPDGLSWTRVTHEDAIFGDAQMSDVTAGGPGLVAVGGTTKGNVAIWTSSDGTKWERVPDEAIIGEQHEGLAGVVAAGPLIVAVGGDASLWISEDGMAWTEVLHDESELDCGVAAVTADDSKIVMVGTVPGTGTVGDRPAVCTVTIPE